MHPSNYGLNTFIQKSQFTPSNTLPSPNHHHHQKIRNKKNTLKHRLGPRAAESWPRPPDRGIKPTNCGPRLINCRPRPSNGSTKLQIGNLGSQFTGLRSWFGSSRLHSPVLRPRSIFWYVYFCVPIYVKLRVYI